MALNALLDSFATVRKSVGLKGLMMNQILEFLQKTNSVCIEDKQQTTTKLQRSHTVKSFSPALQKVPAPKERTHTITQRAAMYWL